MPLAPEIGSPAIAYRAPPSSPTDQALLRLTVAAIGGGADPFAVTSVQLNLETAVGHRPGPANLFGLPALRGHRPYNGSKPAYAVPLSPQCIMKILVVDDHPLVRDGMHHLLAPLAASVEVLEASDCVAALALVHAHPD